MIHAEMVRYLEWFGWDRPHRAGEFAERVVFEVVRRVERRVERRTESRWASRIPTELGSVIEPALLFREK